MIISDVEAVVEADVLKTYDNQAIVRTPPSTLSSKVPKEQLVKSMARTVIALAEWACVGEEAESRCENQRGDIEMGGDQ